MKKLGVTFAFIGSVLLLQTYSIESSSAGSTMSPAKVIFPKLNALLVHCCHAHPVHPYDNYCCHAPGAYVAPAVGAAVAYGSVRRSSRRVARRTGRRVSRRR